MPTCALPKEPVLKYGVFDRNLIEVTAEAQQCEPFHVGWMITPSYHRVRRPTLHRDDAEQHLERERSFWQANRRRLMLRNTDLCEVLNGQSVEGVTNSYYGLEFELTRGGIVATERLRYYWSRIEVPERATHPFVIRRYLKDTKTIRLENGDSIVFNFPGRLKLSNVPDWRLEELYATE